MAEVQLSAHVDTELAYLLCGYNRTWIEMLLTRLVQPADSQSKNW